MHLPLTNCYELNPNYLNLILSFFLLLNNTKLYQKNLKYVYGKLGLYYTKCETYFKTFKICNFLAILES